MKARLLIAMVGVCLLSGCVAYFRPVYAFEPILTDEIAYRGRRFEGWVTFTQDGARLGAQMTPGGPIAGISGESSERLRRYGVREGQRRYIRGTIEPEGICIVECHDVRGEGFFLTNVRLMRRGDLAVVTEPRG